MADYTIKNLKDVDDVAVGAGLSPQLEARFARNDLASEQTGLSYQRLAPGVRHPVTHRHENHEELYVVLQGSGRALLDEEVVEIRELDTIRVAPAIVRTFEAGPSGLTLLAVGPAGSGDSEQQPARWPD